MYEHLGTWTESPTDALSMRLDLWDTGRTDGYGKSKLRYALWICEGNPADLNGTSAIFDGEDYCPSPLIAIDSDEAAGGLLAFFAADGETIRFHDGLNVEMAGRYSKKQRELLESNYEHLGLWSSELEGEL